MLRLLRDNIFISPFYFIKLILYSINISLGIFINNIIIKLLLIVFYIINISIIIWLMYKNYNKYLHISSKIEKEKVKVYSLYNLNKYMKYFCSRRCLKLYAKRNKMIVCYNWHENLVKPSVWINQKIFIILFTLLYVIHSLITLICLNILYLECQ